MDKHFCVGSFRFRLVCEREIDIPHNFSLFENSSHNSSEFTYHMTIADYFPSVVGTILARRLDLTVYETDTGETRLIGIKGQPAPYALYRELSNQKVEVHLAAEAVDDLRFDPVFTSLFALERQMIRRDSMILHCAYIKYRGTAILFSAPSETGKSTQAGLWEKYRGSETVNGDRALLRKIDGRWTACGWPVCGTSEICHLEDIPIHAVAMLRQGKENYVERLSPVQAFTQLYSQITVNQWNREFVQRTVELIEDFVEHVPVWQLTCDISENAVQCLEAALFPTDISGKGGICYEV